MKGRATRLGTWLSVAIVLMVAAMECAAQAAVRIGGEAPTINDPVARIECPPGAPKRTDAIFFGDLYPSLKTLFPAPKGYVAPRLESPPRVFYPPELQMLAVSGFVSVAMLIGEDGAIRDPRIVCSSAPAFERAALDAVATMRYAPASLDGKSMQGIGIQPFVFNLSD